MKLKRLILTTQVALAFCTVTAQDPCLDVSGTIQVSGYNNLHGDMYQFCEGSEVSFSLLDYNLPGGVGNYQYLWYFSSILNYSTNTPVLTVSDLTTDVYFLQLRISQDGVCETVINLDYPISIAKFPTINVPASQNICFGTDPTLQATYSQSNSDTQFYISNDETIEIMDDHFNYYPLEVLLSSNDLTITDCSQIASVFTNLEHSDISDLVIKLECPNGQYALLHNSGGYGIQAGQPINGSNQSVGMGYDYFWAENAPAGTWLSNTSSGTVPSGTYAPIGSLCNLVGCPVNGTWALIIEDINGLYNGYLFEYGINFQLDASPDLLTYIPIIGDGGDSTYWVGPEIISSSSDGNSIIVSGQNLGIWDYTFFATNSSGCTSSSNSQIEVLQYPIGLVVDAGDDFILNLSSSYLNASIEYNGIQGCSNFVDEEICLDNDQVYTQHFCASELFDCSSGVRVDIRYGELEDGYDYVLVFDGPDNTAPVIGQFTGNIGGMHFESSNDSGCLTLEYHTDVIVSCGSGQVSPIGLRISPDFSQYLNYYWTPSELVESPNNLFSYIYTESNSNEYYVFNVTEIGTESCVVRDTVNVQLYQNIISGSVFYDINQNGVMEGTETKLSNFLIHGDNFSLLSTENGTYNYLGDPGENTIEVVYNQEEWIPTTPTVLNLTSVDNQSILNANFGFTPANTVHRVEGRLAGYQAICNTNSKLYFTITNTGNQIESGTAIINIDPILEVLYFIPEASLVVEHHIEYQFSNLNIGQSITYMFDLQNPFDFNEDVFMDFSFSVHLNEAGGYSVSDAGAASYPFVCSFDEAVKYETTGVGPEMEVYQNSELIYTVLFYNPFEYYAYGATIVENLDEALDPYSVQALTSNLPVSVMILEDETLLFSIQNQDIQAISEDNSAIYYVQFSAKQKVNVPIYSSIFNDVDVLLAGFPTITSNTVVNNVGQCENQSLSIIQDENDPTLFTTNLTNVVVDWFFNFEIYESNSPFAFVEDYGQLTAVAYSEGGCVWTSETIETKVEESHLESRLITWPNPAEDVVQWSTNLDLKYLEIFDAVGRLVHQSSINRMNQLDIVDWTSGSYHFVFTTENGTTLHRQVQIVH